MAIDGEQASLVQHNHDALASMVLGEKLWNKFEDLGGFFHLDTGARNLVSRMVDKQLIHSSTPLMWSINAPGQ